MKTLDHDQFSKRILLLVKEKNVVLYDKPYID